MEENNPLKIKDSPKPPILADEQTNIQKLERKRNSKVILLTMDESRSIDRFLVNDIYDLMEKMVKEQPINNLDVIKKKVIAGGIAK